MPAFVDITGQKFNRLTVLGRAGHYPSGIITWRCRCDCGNETVTGASSLRAGATKSCGCLHRETAIEQQKSLVPLITTHGRSKTPEYKAWRNMKSRCYNPKDKRYEEYGPRGIIICPEWRDDFEAFFAHVGEKPSPSATLDRIDNNGNYEPGNVRWATAIQQNNNKRTTPMVMFRGRKVSIGDARRESGSTRPHWQVRNMVLKQGMSIEDVLT